MPRIHILRPGSFRDCTGKRVDLSQADLQQIARDYAPGTAPLITGHRQLTTDPAHGWIRSLSVNDRGMFADVDQVSPEMKRANAAGRYKRCSAQLLGRPGQRTLGHVGMLGARRPAVSGLDEVALAEFAGDEEPENVVVTEIELAAEGHDENNGTSGALSLADRAVNLAREALDAIRGRGAAGGGAAAGGSPPSNGGDDMTNANSAGDRQRNNDELDALKADLAEERKAREASEKRLAAIELARKRDTAKSAVQAAVDAGRLLPRDAEPMTALLAAVGDLPEVDGEPFTVNLAAADDDGEAQDLSGPDYLTDFLGRLPVQVPQGELSGRETGSVELASVGRAPSDDRRIAARAREIQAKDPKTGFRDAAVQAARELHGRSA